MFELNKTIARDAMVDPDDVLKSKYALSALGYYDRSNDVNKYPDNELFTAINSFQKNNDLIVDEAMKPKGETEQYISRKLAQIKEKTKKTYQEGMALKDFGVNYKDMIAADTIGADKYFHCLANYKASDRGKYGSDMAQKLSNKRAKFKKEKRGNSNYDIFEDQTANIWGREAASMNKFDNARQACSTFRPKALNDKY